MTAPALATLSALRDLARSRVAAKGFPSTREEEWKYTNVAPIAETRWEPGPLDVVRRVRPGAALSPVRLVF
ncbi:MAG TPA: Fe-S cluster assembly protein SufD, partial [Planctomycetota bacterium]|nr:Fe-S cluster assembly protein SufD [Planctomycetota bacterium]